jgi:protein ImuA
MSSRPESLETLLRGSPHPLWRGDEIARGDAWESGHAALDERLPGGGWPLGALIEISPACEGLGELRLILPALKSWCEQGRHIAFVRPPYIPYAPALVRGGLPLDRLLWVVTEEDEEARWAAEQLLREGAAAVLLWSAVREDHALRRLQLAAEAGKACAFLYRPPLALSHASPAAVRIALSAADDGVCVELVKVRGGRAGKLTLPLSAPAA